MRGGMPLLDAIFRHTEANKHHRLDYFDGAVLVNVQNVADLFWSGSAPDWATLPNCAPPWPSAWMEFAVPNGKGHGGSLVSAFDPSELTPEALENKFPSGFGAVLSRIVSKNPRWMLRIDSWVSGDPKPFLLANTFLGISPEGQIVSTYLVEGMEELPATVSASSFAREELGTRCDCLIEIPLIAMSFAHCKNVSLMDDNATRRPPSSYLARRNEPFGIKFKVLRIEPMLKILRSEGGMGRGNSPRKALHICRGHFKDYRERGLFGKRRGIYWWDQAVRGEITSGMVKKSYEIKPGASL